MYSEDNILGGRYLLEDMKVSEKLIELLGAPEHGSSVLVTEPVDRTDNEQEPLQIVQERKYNHLPIRGHLIQVARVSLSST